MDFKSKMKSNIILVILALVIYVVMQIILTTLIVIGVAYLIDKTAKIEVNEDISKYNDYIGESAIEEYRSKWGMDESIFPDVITENMQVEDYKMVYYNPWDAQYLSYLVVSYTGEEDYNKEIARLKNYESTEYRGYYGVEGFDKYELIAINADSYQGFVYALTDNENKVIYVELIFCNYCYDIDYNSYIDGDYLPNGFDATPENQYLKKMLKKN